MLLLQLQGEAASAQEVGHARLPHEPPAPHLSAGYPGGVLISSPPCKVIYADFVPRANKRLVPSATAAHKSITPLVPVAPCQASAVGIISRSEVLRPCLENDFHRRSRREEAQ